MFRQPNLSLQALLQRFCRRWSSLPDHRKPNNNQGYTMADGVLSAFGVLFLQSPSFLAHERLLQRNKGWKNARRVFHVTGILSHTQIRNLLEPLSDEALAADFWDILEELRQP